MGDYNKSMQGHGGMIHHQHHPDFSLPPALYTTLQFQNL
jgi:hypothetical protein